MRPRARVLFAALVSVVLGIQLVSADSVQELRQKAETGDGAAQLALAKMYLNGGGGVTKDATEGMKWLSKAAGLSIPEAEYGLAWQYVLANDMGKAYELLRKSAEQG